MKYAFAGNRDLAVWVLNHLIDKGYQPELLLVTDEDSVDIQDLVKLSGLSNDKVFVGKDGLKNSIPKLKSFDLDYIFGIHYPYIIKKEVLDIPKNGFLNLHPGYLPYNRGWNPSSWAILEDTPIGATLHLMSEKLDMGSILNRKELRVGISDTANSLYQKLKDLEFEVFKESLPDLVKGELNYITQNENEGTSHKGQELRADSISRLYLDETYVLRGLITKLRALTTNTTSEAAYFEENGKRYRVQIIIEEESSI